jgi:hypothetical protein
VRFPAQECLLHLAQIAERCRVLREEARQAGACRVVAASGACGLGHECAEFVESAFVRRRKGQVVALIGDLDQREQQLLFGREAPARRSIQVSPSRPRAMARSNCPRARQRVIRLP